MLIFDESSTKDWHLLRQLCYLCDILNVDKCVTQHLNDSVIIPIPGFKRDAVAAS